MRTVAIAVCSSVVALVAVTQGSAQMSTRATARAQAVEKGWSGTFSSTTVDPTAHSRAVVTLTFDGRITPGSWRDRVNPTMFNQPYTWKATYEEHGKCWDTVGSGTGVSGPLGANLGVMRLGGNQPLAFSFQGEGPVIDTEITPRPAPDCEAQGGKSGARIGDLLSVSAPTPGLGANATSIHGQVSVPTRYNPGATTTYAWSLTRPASPKPAPKAKPKSKTKKKA